MATDIGGFGGLFRFDPKNIKTPYLSSGTDGVGTKIKDCLYDGQARHSRH